MYLDDVLVDSLLISEDLKGRVTTQVQVQGSGSGTTREDALKSAKDSMNKLQTVLITGSLPYKLEIVKLDSISPALGKEFTKNIMLLGLIVIGAVWAHRTSLGQALGEPFGRFLKSLGYDLGRPAQKEAVRALFSMGGLMAFLGAYLLFGDILDTASSAGLPKNPIRPSSESRAIGKEIYGQVCLSCHGPEGEGQKTDVQQGLPGLDLRPHVLAHPSGQIYVWVTYGLGAEMPAFEEQLSDEERWHLVNYIRTLGNTSFFGFHAH